MAWRSYGSSKDRAYKIKAFLPKAKKEKIKLTGLHKLQAMYEQSITLTTCRATAVRYSQCLEHFFRRFPDIDNPANIDRADIEDYKLLRLREGVKPVTVNYEITVLGGFFKWLMDMEMVSWNPASQVKKLKTQEPQKSSLSLSDQQQLRQGCFTDMDRILVGLALSTGLRGETMSLLEKSDVDFENALLHIPGCKMKAGRNHEVPIPAWLLEMLKGLPDGRIFQGYAKTRSGITYHWNNICRRAGIKATGIRTARRSFATTLLRSGVDLKIVQDLLGHKNIISTSKYITSADSGTIREAISKLPISEGL